MGQGLFVVRTFLLRRTGIAGGANELDAALTRLRAFEELPPAARPQWLHSYALHESDGRLGLACVFRADGVAPLCRHAESTRLPAGDVLPVASVHVVRPFAPTRVFMIRRRAAWPDASALARGAAAARRVADGPMAREVVWLRSYAVHERDGTLGSVCLFQAVDARALVEHAVRADVPADEINPVLGRIVFRADPSESAAPASQRGIRN